MPFKDLKELALFLSGCFSMLLVASAFAASLLFNWNTPRARSGTATAESCRPAIAESILPTLSPEQEDLLNSDAALGPSEVLGLDEDLNALGKVAPNKVRTPASPAKTPAPKLDSPTNARPNHRADLRRNPNLRLHWDRVPGAADYQVRVWTLKGGSLVVLLDQTTKEPEVNLDPGSSTSLSWQVSARDDKGNLGKAEPPMSVQLLTRSAVKNR